jgi:hypothetical protein
VPTICHGEHPSNIGLRLAHRDAANGLNFNGEQQSPLRRSSFSLSTRVSADLGGALRFNKNELLRTIVFVYINALRSYIVTRIRQDGAFLNACSMRSYFEIDTALRQRDSLLKIYPLLTSSARSNLVFCSAHMSWNVSRMLECKHSH